MSDPSYCVILLYVFPIAYSEAELGGQLTLSQCSLLSSRPADQNDPGPPQTQIHGGLFPQAGCCSCDDDSFPWQTEQQNIFTSNKDWRDCSPCFALTYRALHQPFEREIENRDCQHNHSGTETLNTCTRGDYWESQILRALSRILI